MYVMARKKNIVVPLSSLILFQNNRACDDVCESSFGVNLATTICGWFI